MRTNWRTIISRKFLHCCESSRAHKRFPKLGIWQGTENPHGIWLWRPVGFDYRTSTGLGNRLLQGTNKSLYIGPRRKEQWPYKRLSHTCLLVSRSLGQRHESTLTCHGVRNIEYNSAHICPFEGGCCISPTIVWPQAKLQEGNKAPPINRKLD